MHTSDEAKLKEAVQILHDDDSVHYAQEKAKLVMKKAWESIEPELKSNDAKEDLYGLISYLINRDL